MALVVDQQTKFKYFCRICKKGFMCGRALGGHMRAHGIGDESANIDDEDPASDWEERENMLPENKRNYALRTNPNRFKSCKNCENCGKEFLSWKLFFEHGKCNSGESESLVSLPESDGEDAATGGRGHGWSKKRRSFRGKVGNFSLSSEEDDLAAKCLMLLGSATVDPLVTEPEESCASASKEEERRIPVTASAFFAPLAIQAPLDKAKGASKGVFECKACKKVFNSHQALGGHRASHKKVKGCFASRLDHRPEDEYVISHEDFSMPSKSTSTLQFENDHSNFSKKRSKVHECSICHRVFSSGQALGGHKRCHWITSNSPETSKIHRFHDHMEQIHKKPKLISQSDTLDLNLPAPPSNEITRIRRPLSFEVCTEINLHSWTNVDDHHDQNIDNNCSMQNVEDEEDSKVKLANLSELKDMNMSGGSSPWLQVGIGSTTDVDADP